MPELLAHPLLGGQFFVSFAISKLLKHLIGGLRFSIPNLVSIDLGQTPSAPAPCPGREGRGDTPQGRHHYRRCGPHFWTRLLAEGKSSGTTPKWGGVPHREAMSLLTRGAFLHLTRLSQTPVWGSLIPVTGHFTGEQLSSRGMKVWTHGVVKHHRNARTLYHIPHGARCSITLSYESSQSPRRGDTDPDGHLPAEARNGDPSPGRLSPERDAPRRLNTGAPDGNIQVLLPEQSPRTSLAQTLIC